MTVWLKYCKNNIQSVGYVAFIFSVLLKPTSLTCNIRFDQSTFPSDRTKVANLAHSTLNTNFPSTFISDIRLNWFDFLAFAILEMSMLVLGTAPRIQVTIARTICVTFTICTCSPTICLGEHSVQVQFFYINYGHRLSRSLSRILDLWIWADSSVQCSAWSTSFYCSYTL